MAATRDSVNGSSGSSSSSSKSSNSLIPEYGAHVPEDKDQRVVVTPYGEGLVVRTFRHDRVVATPTDATTATNAAATAVSRQEIVLTSWKSAAASSSSSTSSGRPVRPATLYSSTAYPSVPVSNGCDVICQFGRARVVEIRTDTTKPAATKAAVTTLTVVVVRLSSWRLAHQSRVTCFLDAKSVQVVRRHAVYEMSVVERIEYANELKNEAALQFTKKDYVGALQTYAKAVDAVKFVQHTPQSTNAVRADLLVVMITCSNNAATCCSKLSELQQQQQQQQQQLPLDEAYKHAQQALSLVEALEGRRGSSKIIDELQCEGFTDIRIFGEWKVKSLLIMARVHIEKDDVEAALDTIKKAREVILSFTEAATSTNGQTMQKHGSNTASYQQSIKHLMSNDKELVKLLTRCKERRKAQLKREKQRAQAMFATTASSKRSDNSTATNDSSTTTATTTSSTRSLNNGLDMNGASRLTDGAVILNGTNGGGLAKSPKKSSKSVTFAEVLDDSQNRETRDDDDYEEYDDVELPWHQDPFFLGGLGFLVGVIGTILLVSQRATTRRT